MPAEVEVKEVGPCKKQFNIFVPAEDVQEAFKKSVKEVASTITLPGFRKGKVPKNIIEKRYASELESEVQGQLVSQEFHKALEDNEWKALADPQVENLNFDRKHRLGWLGEESKDWLVEFDGYMEWAAALGNFRTDAYLGALIRAGYNLPVQYMTPRIRVGSYSHSLFIRDGHRFSNVSLYAFGGVRGSAVLHDITLDGPVFKSYDSPVSSETWVGEALIGFGIRFKQLTVTYSRTFRTEEFESQETGHQFGSIQAGIGF